MTTFVRRFPLILFVLGGLGIVVALVRELLDWDDSLARMAVVMIALYIAWIVVELPITMRTSGDDASESDRGSEQLYGMARVATMLSALFLPPVWDSFHPALMLCAVVMVAGIVLRLSAIRTLGRFYSHRVRKLEGHLVAQTGPYRIARHPAYTGMLLAHAGMVSFFCNVASVACLVLLFVPAVVNRILVEEKLMWTVPGYREYAADRKRLVPLVW